MRYLVIAAILIGAAACSVPPQTPTHEPVAGPVVLPEVEVRAEREYAAKPSAGTKQKVRMSFAPCAHLARGGDSREDIHAKLDCLEKHIR